MIPKENTNKLINNKSSSSLYGYNQKTYNAIKVALHGTINEHRPTPFNRRMKALAVKRDSKDDTCSDHQS